MPVVKNLRKLYGRSPRGTRSREHVRATITTDTMDLVRSIVDVHKGGYGSPFIELSMRTMIALLGNSPEDMEIVAQELKKSVESPYFADNLERMSRLFKA